MLQRLTYISRPSSRLDIELLVRAAADNNQRRGVSGLLLYDDNTILQVLEGPRHEVSPLFLRIASDARHSDVTLVNAHWIDQQCYPQWGMALLDNALKTRALWSSASGAAFNPFEMRAQAISDFVRLATFELLSATEVAASR
jgi:hypothetical protein